MKTMIFLLIASILCLSACNNAQSHRSNESATDSLINTGTAPIKTAYAQGATLIAKNDCLTCHKINEKNVGPSYIQIADKYQFKEGVVENLAGKIISGGKGLWGDAAMTPHPNTTFNDAKEMVRYILSLKENRQE